MNQRLKHDTAVAIAQACLDVVASCIEPVCHPDAKEEFYHIAMAGMEALAIQEERMQQRLKPSTN